MSKRSRNNNQHRSPSRHSEQQCWSRCDTDKSDTHHTDSNYSHSGSLANLRIFENVAEIFNDKIEHDVIRMVLEESEWKEETAVEKLIEIATSDEPAKPQMDLAIIACSLLEDEVPDKSRVEEVTLMSKDSSVDCNRKTSTDVNYCMFDPEAMAATEQSVLAMYDDILQGNNFVFSPNQEPSASRILNQESGAEILHSPTCCNPGSFCLPMSDLVESRCNCSAETCQTSVPSSNIDVDDKRAEDFSGRVHSETYNTCADAGFTGKDNNSPLTFLHSSTLISSPSDSEESSCSTHSSLVQELESLGHNQDSVLWGQISSSLPSSIGAGKDAVARERTLPAFEQMVHTFSGDVLESLSPTELEDYSSNLPERTELRRSASEAFFERGSGSRMEGFIASESELTEDPGTNINTFLSADAPEFVPTFVSSTSVLPNISFFSRADCFCSTHVPVQYSPYPSRIIGEPLYSRAPENAQYSSSQVSSRNVALKNLVGRNLYHTSVQAGANRPSAGMNYSAAARSSGQTVMGSKTSKAVPPVIDVPPSAELENVRRLIQCGLKVMVIMRGLPGSGKSHLARQIQANGQVFSTDDYFLQNGIYCYSQQNLSEAHDWNNKRVRDAVDKGASPVVVDNTNVMIWELLPYAQLAHARGYEVEILEPCTPWKWQPKRLAKYNCHGVSIESIKKMKDRFEILDTAGLKTLLKNAKCETNVPRPTVQVIDSSHVHDSDQDRMLTPQSSSPALPRNVQNQPVQQGSISHGYRRSETRMPPKLSKNKKRAKKIQGEVCKPWEYIYDLLQRGATDDEIDSIIYISQFTDAEKQEIQSRRNSLKMLVETRITEKPPNLPVHFGRSDEELAVNKGPISSSIEDAEGRTRNRVNLVDLLNSSDAFAGAFEADQARDSADLSWETSWEDPKPQRGSRASKEQITTKVENSMENNMPDDEKAGIIGESATSQIQATTDVRDDADIIHKTDIGDETQITGNNSTSDKTNEPPFESPQSKESTHSTVIAAASGAIHTHFTVLEGTENPLSVVMPPSEDSREPSESREISPELITEPSSGSEDSGNEASLGDKAGAELQTLTEDAVHRTHMFVNCSSSSQATSEDDGSMRPSETTQTCSSSSESFSHAPEEPNARTESNRLPMPDSPRKKPRRKKNRTPAKPFLDDIIKQQFHQDSWKAFTPENQITEVELGEGDNSSAETFTQKVEVQVASSQTEVRDFSIAFMVETSMPDETSALGEGYLYLRSKGHFTSARPTLDMTTPSSRLKQTLDKGTSIDVMLEQVEPNLEILQNCFPEVAAGHLREVLDVCQGDMEWATNLILDWGVSTPFTTSDKDLLRQEMARHQMLSAAVSTASRSSPGMSGDTRRLFQPPSLFELCRRQLMTRAENAIIRDDVQRQVIRSGYQRLQRIESVEQERAKKISWDKDSILSSLGKPHSPSKALELSETVKAKSGSPQLEEKRIKDLAEEIFSLSSSQSSSKSGSLDDLQSVGADFKELKPFPVVKKFNVGGAVAASSPTEFVSREVQTVPCIDIEGDLSITVSLDLIKNLERLFGPLPLPAKGSSIALTLDTIAAQHLYACLSISLSQPQTDEELSRIQQLKEDEALAQRLQSLEDSRVLSARPVPVQRKQPKKAVGKMVPMKQPSCPVMLQDIIDEEMARQEKRESVLKQLESTGSHLAIATKLKREKLYKHFPGIDESFLEEIFQANGYCLETTVSVIEGALGNKQPVSHRLDMSVASSRCLDADAEDQENIEIAKQQSIFNLIQKAWNEDQNHVGDGSNREEFDYTMLRQESYVHHRMRTECFEKAQEAYRRGMREVAMFYSQEGHRHTQLMQEANVRASQKILEARRAKLDQEMVLDLHGLHTDEAVAALKQVLAEKEKEFQQKPVHNRQFLYVITGRGKHSHNGLARLRPAVTDYLSSSGHRFVGVHTGMLKVTLHPAA